MKFWEEYLWVMALVATIICGLGAIIAAVWLLTLALGIYPIWIVMAVLVFLWISFIATAGNIARDFKEWLLPKLKNWRGKAS